VAPEPVPGGATDEQLAAIASLSSTLERHGVDHWLFGGWAVDFWAGAVTRPHDDVDVAAWRDDYDAIRAALEPAGWQHEPADTDVVGTVYRYGPARVEFTFVVADAAGRVILPFPERPAVWSAEPFGDDRRTLRGVSCRTIPLSVLRTGKSVPREGAAEGAKDRADLRALDRLDG
jgi:hypothetical protein